MYPARLIEAAKTKAPALLSQVKPEFRKTGAQNTERQE